MLSFRRLTASVLIALLWLAGCRLDMQVQPRLNPLAKSDFYPDQRSARLPVEGTVARGDLQEDTYFYSGKIGSNPGDYMPFSVNQDVMLRGRERFKRLRKAPLGYFFDVMTNGFGAMPDYASQVSARDRWSIVAYIRALQLSQNASSAEIPAGQKIPSAMTEQRSGLDSGATPPARAPSSRDKSAEERK